jgi:hypothetical protein
VILLQIELSERSTETPYNQGGSMIFLHCLHQGGACTTLAFSCFALNDVE